MGLGFMYQSSIKGVSRVDMFNLSLDIDAFDVLGSRYISVVKFWMSFENLLGSWW